MSDSSGLSKLTSPITKISIKPLIMAVTEVSVSAMESFLSAVKLLCEIMGVGAALHIGALLVDYNLALIKSLFRKR